MRVSCGCDCFFISFADDLIRIFMCPEMLFHIGGMSFEIFIQFAIPPYAKELTKGAFSHTVGLGGKSYIR